METKTYRFGNISDSATHSTSYRRFFEIHFVAEIFLEAKKDVRGEVSSESSSPRLIVVCLNICLVTTSLEFPNFVGRLSI